MVGCGVTATNTSKDNPTTTTQVGQASPSASTSTQVDTADKIKEEIDKAKGKEVKLLMWFEPNDSMKENYKKFEDKYGMKIKHITTDGSSLPLKLITMINAGDPPDVVPVQAFAVPSIIIKKIIQPMENYMDLKNPVYKISDMDEFKMDGHYYAATSGVGPYLLFYNKTMFENNGVKTPEEYYKEGNWTFENFRKAAMELTKDTNNDGQIDQWGYTTNLNGFEFVSRNGGSYVNFNSVSAINLTIEEPQTVEALQFFQDAYVKDKYIMPNGDNAYTTDFEAGKIAMTVSPDWIIDALIKPNMKDEWGFTSLPLGPKGDKMVQPSSWFAWGIAAGSKNPYGAGAYITFNYESGAENDKKNGTLNGNKLTEEQVALWKQLNEKVVFNKAEGIGDWSNAFYAFVGELKEGKTLSSLIAKYKPQLQTEVDNILKDSILPDTKPVETIPAEDFESGKMNLVTINGCEGAESANLTTDANEIIAGKNSLKLVLKKGVNWGTSFLKTDAVNCKLPANHIYNIKCDYNVLEAPDGFGVYLAIKSGDGAKSYGWIAADGLKSGTKGTLQGKIGITTNSKDCYLDFMSPGTGATIVIDSLTIEEDK